MSNRHQLKVGKNISINWFKFTTKTNADEYFIKVLN